MKRLLVWDLPVRLFHVLLAALFVLAFGIAQLADDDSPLFSAHMLLGLLMAFMVILRVVWGFVGTRHARFSDFAFKPRAILGYLGNALRGRASRHAGHNPGASVAIFAMLAFVIGLAVTGIMISKGSEEAEDVHGLFAYGLLLTVIAHLVGVALHTFRARENIALSMVDGKKETEPSEAIAGARPIVGLVFLALTAIVGWRLAAGFDATTRTLSLPLVGQTLQLGESEEGEHGGPEWRRGDRDDDD